MNTPLFLILFFMKMMILSSKVRSGLFVLVLFMSFSTFQVSSILFIILPRSFFVILTLIALLLFRVFFYLAYLISFCIALSTTATAVTLFLLLSTFFSSLSLAP